MNTKTGTPPPSDFAASDPGMDPPAIEVELTGFAAEQAVAGATAARMTVGDFVIDSTIAVAAMAKWESLGYRILARDRFGHEYDLTPAVLGIHPPPALLD